MKLEATTSGKDESALCKPTFGDMHSLGHKFESTMDHEKQIDDMIVNLISAANQQQGRDVCAELVVALNEAAELPTEVHPELRKRVAQAIPKVKSESGAGVFGVWLGSSVEAGADPEVVVDEYMQSFLEITKRIKTLPQDSEVPDVPLSENLEVGVEYLGQGLVAHIARCPDKRESYSQNSEMMTELSRVSHLSVGAYWVETLLAKRSGELVVIHAEELKGAHVRFKNISNCFHLFTLLQAALQNRMPGAKSVDPDVLSVAIGEQHFDVNDSAWWHFGQPESSEPDIIASVFGEASPDSIGEVDGVRIMLLWSPILQDRSWDGGFFQPSLMAAPASVDLIEELDESEVQAWHEKLGLST